MIPKTIHYCWFGRNPKPKKILDCIASWKRILPEYTIKEWNEDNFDLACCDYVREAYEAKKWAFVTDYVRLYALYTEGGIYLDSDVEVVKSLDPYLDCCAFSGRESARSCLTGTMGAEKGSAWIRDMLEPYATRHFVREDGSLNMTTNVVYANEVLVPKGLPFEDSYFEIKDYVRIYPTEIFCPKSLRDNHYRVTSKTATIHHFASSWHTPRERFVMDVERRFGKRLAQFTALITHNPFYIIKRIVRRLKTGV